MERGETSIMSYISRANSDAFDFGFGLGMIFIFVIPAWFIAGLFYPDLFELTWILFVVLFILWIQNIVRDKVSNREHEHEELLAEQEDLRNWFNSLPVDERADLVRNGTVTLTDAKTGKRVDPTPYIMD